MNEQYTVRVTKDYLVFSAGHFITYDGDHCERLHGHNYRVAATLTGGLDANHYLFDFIALRDRLQEICAALDHRMLIATHGELIRAEVSENRVTLRYQDRTWMFPREDCVLLPIESTTTELLAKHIADELLKVLEKQHDYQPASFAIEVEESFGLSATYEWRRG